MALFIGLSLSRWNPAFQDFLGIFFRLWNALWRLLSSPENAREKVIEALHRGFIVTLH